MTAPASQLRPWAALPPRRGQLVRIISTEPIGNASAFGAHGMIEDVDERDLGMVAVAIEGFPHQPVSLDLEQLVPADDASVAAHRATDERLTGEADGLAMRLGALVDELPDRTTPAVALRLFAELLDIRRRQEVADLEGASVGELEALDDDRRHVLFQLLHGEGARPCTRCRPEVLRPALWHIKADGQSFDWCTDCYTAGCRALVRDLGRTS